MKEIGINIQPCSSFGWGIVGLNLLMEFARGQEFLPVLTIPPGELDLSPEDSANFNRVQDASGIIMDFNLRNPGQAFILDIPLIYPGGNKFQHRLNVGTSKESYSISVFEDSDLGIRTDAEKNHFTKIFAGSRWNADILNANGFQNVQVWNQGVDTKLFSPATSEKKYPGRFLVFSGGKLEFRKGQDIAIEAFKRFQAKHQDAMLVTAWDSPWMELAATFSISPWVSCPPSRPGRERLDIRAWLESEGIPPENHWDIGAIPNRLMPSVLRQCDAAVFPSRGEGATNLVAMESIACGIPTLVSANTGHLDLLKDVPAIPVEEQRDLSNKPSGIGTEGWGESDVEEIVQHLDWIYSNQAQARENALFAADAIQARSWVYRAKDLAGMLLE
jgi:glycosyltransferase involved in cell wall biosynthesis